MAQTNNRLGDVDRMVDKMIKLSDDLDRRNVEVEVAVKKARIVSVVFSGISLRRKLVLDAQKAEIDVTPKKAKALKAATP